VEEWGCRRLVAEADQQRNLGQRGVTAALQAQTNHLVAEEVPHGWQA
jgi:hypothetical protein